MNDKTPAKRLEFVISPKGEIRSIFSPESDQILRDIAEKHGGEVVTRRASHVEPTEELRDEAFRWLHEKAYSKPVGEHHADIAAMRADWCRLFAGHWWADLTPVNGPVLGPYGTGDRDKALADEIEWLKANNIPVCEPCVRSAFPALPQTTLVECDGLGPIPMRITPDERRGESGGQPPADFDYAALEMRLMRLIGTGRVVKIDDCIIVDSAAGIEPRDLLHISRLPQDIGLMGRPFFFGAPPIQHISPLPPEKRKVRRAFLNGEQPVRERNNKQPLRRTRQ